MAVNNKTHPLHLGILILLGIVFLSVFFTLIKPWQYKTATPQTKLGRYESSNLNSSIQIPSSFEVKEQVNRVILTREKKQIIVEKIYTNFDNIDGYLSDISEKNGLLILDKKTDSVNNLGRVKVKVRYPSDPSKAEVWYLFYPLKGTIYTISTDSEALYDELDQIAQSFRYIP